MGRGTGAVVAASSHFLWATLQVPARGTGTTKVDMACRFIRRIRAGSVHAAHTELQLSHTWLCSG
jgi:hypothetical protein